MSTKDSQTASRAGRFGHALVALLAASASTAAGAASLEFFVNAPSDYDYGTQLVLPAGFGNGEFTLELWIRPNDSFPTGSTAGGTGQRENWSNADLQPYSSSTWWYAGNFLLDGHNNGNFTDGTFSLQFYGSGRVRWLFGDGVNAGPGGIWSVQAFPATTTPSLLDGNWHQLTLVRRWVGAADAQLELWVDGQIVDMEIAGGRVNMRQWWDNWSGFAFDQRGWFWGAEKFAANGGAQWEDYKGLIDELRFWSRAKTSAEIQTSYAAPVVGNEPGLVGWYDLDETSGLSTCSGLVTTQCMNLTATSTRPNPQMWSVQNAPLSGGNDTQAPSTPFNLQGTPVSASRIDLTWNASNDNVAVAGYRVRRNGNLVGTVAGTAFSDTGLTASTPYNYTVSAFDAAGNESPQSASVPVTTPPPSSDAQAPTVPGGLQGAAVSSSRIDLSWTASTDNVAVTGYRIRRNGTVVGTPAGTSFSDTALAASTTYSYTVAAFDAAGNESAASGGVNVTTQAAPPPPGGGGGGGGGSAGYFELLLLLLLGLGGSLRKP